MLSMILMQCSVRKSMRQISPWTKPRCANVSSEAIGESLDVYTGFLAVLMFDILFTVLQRELSVITIYLHTWPRTASRLGSLCVEHSESFWSLVWANWRWMTCRICWQDTHGKLGLEQLHDQDVYVLSMVKTLPRTSSWSGRLCVEHGEMNYFKDKFTLTLRMTRARAISPLQHERLSHAFIWHVQGVHDEVWRQRLCIESVNAWPDLTNILSRGVGWRACEFVRYRAVDMLEWLSERLWHLYSRVVGVVTVVVATVVVVSVFMVLLLLLLLPIVIPVSRRSHSFN